MTSYCKRIRKSNPLDNLSRNINELMKKAGLKIFNFT